MRLAVVLLFVVCGLFTGAGTAWAHASLLATDPEQDAVLSEVPEQARLTFNEPVQLPGPDAVALFDAAGTEHPTTAWSVDDTVVVSLPDHVERGSYMLRWRVISADTHPVSGTLDFAIGAASPQPATVPQDASGSGLAAAQATVQALLYGGLFASAGLVVFTVLFLPAAGTMPRLRRRLWHTALLAGALAVLAALLLVPLTAAQQHGSGLLSLLTLAPWQEGLASPHGLLTLLLAAGLSTAMVARPDAPTLGPRRGIALAGSLLALGALALVGHTRSAGPTTVVVTADVTHVAAGAVWFGGLLGLALSLRTLTRDGPAHAAAATVRRFSAAAAVTVAALAAAGTILAWRILDSWAALIHTPYGWLLLSKIALAAATVTIAAWNRYRLVPRLATPAEGPTPTVPRFLRRTISLEAGVLVLVLALTGVLTGRDPAAPAAHGSAPQPVTATAGTLRVTATARPGTTGRNTLTFRVTDTEGEPITPGTAPEVTLRSAQAELNLGAQQVTEAGPGRYRLTTILPEPGTWTAAVSIRRSEFRNPVIELPLTVTD